jgi:hypothetical protein
MALDRAACFNVPGIFSPHRLTIRYPPERDDSQLDDVEDAKVGEKRKEPEVPRGFLEEEIVLCALEIAAESEVGQWESAKRLRGFSLSKASCFNSGPSCKSGLPPCLLVSDDGALPLHMPMHVRHLRSAVFQCHSRFDP